MKHLSLSLSADLCIQSYWLSRLRQASHRKMIQSSALRLRRFKILTCHEGDQCDFLTRRLWMLQRKPWSLHTTVAKLGSIYCGNAENCHQGCSTTLLLATWSGYKKKDLRQKYIKSLDFFCLLLTCEWASKDQESNNGPRVKWFKVA